jgi:hypothetical protein
MNTRVNRDSYRNREPFNLSTMSLQQYATLTPDLSSVQSIDTWNTTTVSALQAAGNPKFTFLRVVNITAQPAFDPTTQSVIQNGWTITAVDVQPVWVVQTLSPATQQALAAQTFGTTRWLAILSPRLTPTPPTPTHRRLPPTPLFSNLRRLSQHCSKPSTGTPIRYSQIGIACHKSQIMCSLRDMFLSVRVR